MTTAMRKKLSISTTYGKIVLTELPADATPKWILDVMGRVIGVKTGTSNYGEWTALVGRFRYKNLETGEVLDGSKAFLPDMITEPLAVQLTGDGVSFVDFAVKIGVVRSSSPIGYEYVAQSLVDPTGDGDPLEALSQKAAAAQRQLDAPKKEAKEPAAPKGAGKKK